MVETYSTFRSEYGAFWKCIQAGGIYVFTQLCKMLVLATFFDSDSLGGGTGDFNFLAVSGSRDSRKTLLIYLS